ncbi:MAG TPA: glycosyltransferase family 2 protein, partial [Bacteroidota bacterium]
MRLHEAGQPYPVVSVIMPVCNEGTFIQRSLGAVTAQEYPRELLEILVVDGMSDDGTRELVLTAGRADARIRLIDNPRCIVSCAFNLGLREARGDVIVRVDGHTIIAADYVAACVAALLRTGADNVGGRMQPEGSTPFGRAVAMATSVPFGVGGGRFHYSADEEWVDTVYLGAWRREIFDRLGGFDEEMVKNQDDEFNYRLREDGGRILLSPAIRSRYFNRTSPRLLWKQYFAYGFWKVRVMQKHPRQMR